MKRVIALVFLVGFISSCGYHTCPTYAKKAPVEKTSSDKNV
jgi:hypothetical protein